VFRSPLSEFLGMAADAGLAGLVRPVARGETVQLTPPTPEQP
jgi:hypothetical protein